MQNSARCVLPVRSTSRCRNTRSTSHGGGASRRSGTCANAISSSWSESFRAFVDARMLARRAEEEAREEERQRRVVVPVAEQAPQQIGPAQERTVGRRRAAEHDVIAAAGAGMPAVEHELLGAEPASGAPPRRAWSSARRSRPGVSRVHVDLDDAGIGRHLEVVEPRIGSGGVPFDDDRHLQLAAVRSMAAIEIEVVLGRLDRGHEHVDAAVPRLDAERSANHARGRLASRRLLAATTPTPDTWRRRRARARRGLPIAACRDGRRDWSRVFRRRPPAPTMAASRAATGSRLRNRRE